MKKIICLLLMCTLLLAGCSSQEAAAPVTVNLWHYYNGPQQEAFQALVDAFNQTVGQEQHITVVTKGLGSIADLTQAVEDSLAGRVGAATAPEMFFAYADTAFSLNQSGYLADVSPYLMEETLSALNPAYVQEGRLGHETGLYIYPVAKSTEALYVNWTAWQQFQQATGADESDLRTWEGLKRLGESYYAWTDSLTPETGDGAAFFGRDAYANYLLAGSQELGENILQATGGQGSYHLNKQVLRTLWDAFCVPYAQGIYAAQGRYRSDDMKTGNILAYVGSTSSVSFVPTQVTRSDGETLDIEVRVFPVPSFAQAEEPYAVQQGAGLAVVKGDEAKEKAAVTFLTYITQKEENLSFALASGYMPVNLAASDAATVQAALKERGVEETSVMGQNQLISARTTREKNLLPMAAFAQATQARGLLETDFRTHLEVLRENYLHALEGGMTPEEATQSTVGDAAFEAWVLFLEEQLPPLT